VTPEGVAMALPKEAPMADESTRKIKLTDRGIKALKPAPDRRPFDVRDSVVPGLRVRVMSTGALSFVVLARFPGSANPTRRSLGAYGRITLEEARAKAREWFLLIGRGVDPAVQEERQRQAELRQLRTTFGAIAEEYITKKVARTAKRVETEQDIRRELIPRWGKKPITDVTRHDVIAMAEEIAARAKYQSHNVFGHVRCLFNWAITRGVYGIETSPCDRLRPADLIGKKKARNRVLNDAELRALWQATEALNYPCGPLVRLLLITGQRRNEVARARWSEFDLGAKLWSIPAARMKADRAHVVPLSVLAIETLEALPRFKRGDHVFSSNYGQSPVNGFARMKERLDRLVADRLGTAAPPWVLHDVRRTMRTGLSALPVSDLVRELIIAHAKPGLHAVYDQHAYENEKRHALDLWAARLRDIVEPAPAANVVSVACG
jgi:integrase